MRVIAFEGDKTGINIGFIKTGIFILIDRNKTMFHETIDSYMKSNCVEIVFEPPKSHLEIDKIGVTTEEAMHGK